MWISACRSHILYHDLFSGSSVSFHPPQNLAPSCECVYDLHWPGIFCRVFAHLLPGVPRIGSGSTVLVLLQKPIGRLATLHFH